MRALTYALTQPEARDVLASLSDASDPAVGEALVEILARPHSAPLASAALALLAESDHPLAIDALIQALDSPLVTVRQPAMEALARRGVFHAGDRLVRLLQEDDSWLVRRGVVRALAVHPEPVRWKMLLAADDPHWRVRHALIRVLLESGQNPTARADIDARLASLPAHPRIEGVRGYLAARWNGSSAAPALEESNLPWPFWDPDPAVMVRKLDELGEAGRRRHLDLMPLLLSHEADRARQLAVETLRRRAGPAQILLAVGQLDDLRAGAGDAVAQLLRGIDLDRVEEAARLILHSDESSPAQLAWAIDQAGPVFPPEEEIDVLGAHLQAVAQRQSGTPPRSGEGSKRAAGSPSPLQGGGWGEEFRAASPVRVRRALARLASRWPDACRFLDAFLNDADDGVRAAALSGDPTLHRLTPSLAADLLASLAPEVCIAAVPVIAIHAELTRGLERVVSDPDSRVRVALAEALVQTNAGSPLLAILRDDPHPLVRAAALSPERAAELIAHPERETSWHVLDQACRMQKTPLWKLEPKPAWQAPARTASLPEPLTLRPGAPPHARTLGPRRLVVAPLGVSGHYGLPVEGFVKAVEAGVNLLFWEPNYQTLTRFSGRLSPGQRRQLHFLAGTFEASGARIRKDVERAVRNLQIEQLSLFLIFWTRSWERITDEVRGTVERLQHEGLIGMAGLSTHSRPLAVEALAGGWNPVMVRHSAAHRGAETQVFPHAGPASIITFNNTCYGRLLKPLDRPPPRPSDCYRYTLSFPAVTMCMSAPATLEQLDENLQALHDPELPEERRRLLLEQGAEVYREETLFRRLVRSR